MKTRSRSALACACLLFLSLSCSRQPDTSEQRIFILPPENQSSDASLDWVSAVIASALDYDLTGLPHLTPVNGAGRANRVLRAYFTSTNQRLALHAALEDPGAPKRIRTIVEEGPLAAGVVPLTDALAKELGASARAFPARDPGALKTFGQAQLLAAPAERATLLRAAITQDPGFAPAYSSLAETLMAQNDRVGAAEVAATGAAKATQPIDRARLQFLGAVARDDLDGRERALASLVTLTPGDPEAFQRLGETHAIQRRFPEAIRDYETAARLEPGDGSAYNFLAYLHAYSNDLPGARDAISKYQELAPPGDANPVDSLGEINFLLGFFKEAERRFTEAHEPLKSAQARLMTGDLPGADALFKTYLEASGIPPAVREFQQAQWEAITGRRVQATARMQQLAASTVSGVAALAGSQLAIWSGHLPPGAANTGLLQAVGFLLSGEFAQAVAPLEAAERGMHPANDGQVRALLAWAYVESGQIEKAKPLVRLYPLPVSQAEPLLNSLVFPQFLKTRATALAGEAGSDPQRDQQLYSRYSAH